MFPHCQNPERCEGLLLGWKSRWILEARAGIEPAIEVLQTSALPLGYRASQRQILRLAAQDFALRLRSGQALRAPASLTPAKRLNLATAPLNLQSEILRLRRGCSTRKTLASSEGRQKTGAGDGI